MVIKVEPKEKNLKKVEDAVVIGVSAILEDLKPSDFENPMEAGATLLQGIVQAYIGIYQALELPKNLKKDLAVYILRQAALAIETEKDVKSTQMFGGRSE